MPRWTAQCYLGSKSGIVDIETNAATITGAKEQYIKIYGAQTVSNIRRIPDKKSSSSSTSPEGSGAIIGLIAALMIFAWLTPWIMMLVYGSAATWLGQKITGLKIEDYADIPDNQTTDNQHIRASITILATLFFGGLGFVQGTQIYNEIHNTEPKVEEIKTDEKTEIQGTN